MFSMVRVFKIFKWKHTLKIKLQEQEKAKKTQTANTFSVQNSVGR